MTLLRALVSGILLAASPAGAVILVPGQASSVAPGGIDNLNAFGDLGCASNEVLAWNLSAASWECASAAVAGEPAFDQFTTTGYALIDGGVQKAGDTMTGDLTVQADVSITGGDLTLGGTFFITPGGHQIQNYAGNGGLRMSVADDKALIIQSSSSYASGISTGLPTLFYIIKGNNNVSFDPNAFIGYEERGLDFFGTGPTKNSRFIDLEGNASKFGAWTWSILNLSPLRINVELMSLKENEGTPDATLLVNGTITTTSMTVLGRLQLTQPLDESNPTIIGNGLAGFSFDGSELYVSIDGIHRATFTDSGLFIAGNFTAAKVTAGTVIGGNIIIVENSRVNLDAFVGGNFTTSGTVTTSELAVQGISSFQSELSLESQGGDGGFQLAELTIAEFEVLTSTPGMRYACLDCVLPFVVVVATTSEFDAFRNTETGTGVE